MALEKRVQKTIIYDLKKKINFYERSFQLKFFKRQFSHFDGY